MSAPAAEEPVVEERLQALRQKLGRKQHFEEAVADLAATLRDRYAGASPALRKSMYSAVCRVATVLQTRYTAPGFWRAGLNLFIGTEKLVTNPSEKEHLKTCISRAREHVDEKENEESMPSNREADSILEKTWTYYDQGHLDKIIDSSLGDDLDVDEACRFLKVGLLCTQDITKHRPTMSAVVSMLRGEMDVHSEKISKPDVIRDFRDLKLRSNATSSTLLTSIMARSSPRSSEETTRTSITFTAISDRD